MPQPFSLRTTLWGAIRDKEVCVWGGSFKPRFPLYSPHLLISVHQVLHIAFPSNTAPSPAGGSLKCYTCKTQLSNSKCQTETTCANSSTGCKTDVISKRRLWGGKVLVWYQTPKGLTQRHRLGCANRPPHTHTPFHCSLSEIPVGVSLPGHLKACMLQEEKD